MLRITPVKSKDYLIKGLTKADYYIEGTEQILGQWKGNMVEVLGLRPGVTVSDFESLYDNINPITGQQITERMRDDRKPFYDFTFSTPKSVSILWAITDNLVLRNDITKAMQDSVDESMTYAQKHFTLGREQSKAMIQEIGESGNTIEKERTTTKYHKTNKILYTKFLHDTSRPVGGIPDPHLHIHVGVFNMTQIQQGNFETKGNSKTKEDNKVFRSIEFSDFCRFREMTEAVHSNLLAHKLQELGIELNNTHKSFEIVNFSRDLIEDFSNRTKLIEKYNLDHNIQGANQKGQTGSITREHKDRAKKLTEGDLKAIYTERLGNQGRLLVSKYSDYGNYSHVVDNHDHNIKTLDFIETQNSSGSDNSRSTRKADSTNISKESEKIDTVDTSNQTTQPTKYHQLRTNKELVKEKAQIALEHSLIHNFERDTTVVDYKLLSNALNYNLTEIKLNELEKTMTNLIQDGELINGTVRRQRVLTSRGIIEEERAITQMVTNSKDTIPAIAPDYTFDHNSSPNNLSLNSIGKDNPTAKVNPMSKDQEQVFYSVLQSTDSIQYIKGDAGAGKTYLINNLKQAMEEKGKEVYAFAPTSIAGRKVLREEVTDKADTVRMLLTNITLQKKLNKDSIVFIDEAGMIGYQEMKKILEIRQDKGFTVILVGDTKQHSSVARGDALHFMEQKTNLIPFTLTDNRRQKDNPSYLEAIDAFAKKDTNKAIELLDNMGAIKEIEQSTKRYEAIAKEYTQTIKKFKNWDEAKKDILVVTPTHTESNIVTNKIRRQLKKEKIIGKSDITYTILQDKTLSEAQKQDTRNYNKGDIIQFNQNVEGGIKRGTQWEVCVKYSNNTTNGNTTNSKISDSNTTNGNNQNCSIMMKELEPEIVKPNDDKLQLITSEQNKQGEQDKKLKNPKPRKLTIPTQDSDKFQVFQKQEIKLTQGDLLKMTNNGSVGENNDKRVFKGGIYAIKKIEQIDNQQTPDKSNQKPTTQITLENGWKLPANYGHINHGYTSTSYSSQGRTVKHLIIAQSQLSNPASSFQQGYVSASRGKVSISLYTDNKEELTKSYKRIRNREFAQNLGSRKSNRTPSSNYSRQNLLT
jgi:conjugative relaxase-like TrwC/TraI family protein